jgi:uncharacterized protein
MNERARPYVTGALAGLLAVASAVVSTALLDKPQYLGASTTFVRAAGLIEQRLAPERTADNAYFARTRIKVDWQMLLVAGIFFGALAASALDRSFKLEKVPPVWKDRFGPGIGRRALGGFLGGAVAMVGARMAGGCPSGHGLSGLMQLSLSGLIAMAGFFAAGIAVAHLTYRKEGHNDRARPRPPYRNHLRRSPSAGTRPAL